MGRKNIKERTIGFLILILSLIINILLLAIGIIFALLIPNLVEQGTMFNILNLLIIVWTIIWSIGTLIQVFLLIMHILDKEIKITGED